MTPSEDLFHLIQSMTRTEKAYFKKYSQRYIHGKKNNAIKLFSVIEKQSSYDESAVKRKLKDESFIKDIHAAKYSLYRLIVKSLTAYHADNHIFLKIKALQSQAYLLLKKGLIEQGNKPLNRLKKLAAIQHDPLLAIEILRQTFNSIRQAAYSDTSETALMQLAHDLRRQIQLFTNEFEYRYLLDHVQLSLTTKQLTIRNKKELEILTEIQKNTLLQDEKKAMSPKAKAYYHMIHSIISRIGGNHETSYYHNLQHAKIIELIAATEENTGDLIIAYNRILADQMNLKKYDDALKTLGKLEDIKTISRADEAMIFYLINGNKLHIYYATGDHDAGLMLIDEIQKGFKEHADLLGDLRLKSMYFNIAGNYFILGKFEKAADWYKKILETTNPETRKEVHATAMLINLICHFEMEHHALLESLVRSTYRFLLKKERLYKFETHVIDFIRRKTPKIVTQQDMIEALKELRQKLISLTKDPFEKGAFTNFDIISWMESKIQRKPLADILQKKRSI